MGLGFKASRRRLEEECPAVVVGRDGGDIQGGNFVSHITAAGAAFRGGKCEDLPRFVGNCSVGIKSYVLFYPLLSVCVRPHLNKMWLFQPIKYLHWI